MRHRKAFRKFSRTSAHRKAMFRNLATSLFQHEQIETTLAKAKDLRRVSEKLITLAKKDTLHRRRQAYAYLPSKAIVHKLFAEIGPKFADRPGGYTRIVKSRHRAGDAAPMAFIELVQEKCKPKKKKLKTKAEVKKIEKRVEKKGEESKAEESKAEEATQEVVEASKADAPEAAKAEDAPKPAESASAGDAPQSESE